MTTERQVLAGCHAWISEQCLKNRWTKDITAQIGEKYPRIDRCNSCNHGKS